MLGGIVVDLVDRHRGVNHVRLNSLFDNVRELSKSRDGMKKTYAC